MTERLKTIPERHEKLLLSDIKNGDTLNISTGSGENTWQYTFIAGESNATSPRGTLHVVNPSGQSSGPFDFRLAGAGKWTTWRQNPVQQQEEGFTSYWDSVYVGGLMVGYITGNEQVIFGSKGDEINEITLKRYQDY